MTALEPRAAVAVVVRGLGSDDPRVLLGRRRHSPSDPWSGHLAFPGGRAEDHDADLLDTALRECHEEAGIRFDRARAVGALPDEFAGRVTGANLPVRPWLVRAESGDEPGAGDGEMVGWEWFPLRDLDDPALRTEVEPRPGLRLPGTKRPDGAVLWGMTHRVLERLWTESVVPRGRWWLDYDGTMYPSSHVLTDEVDRRITQWVATARGIPLEEADLLRKRLYREHGNTLRGMMRESDTDPNAYLDYVFDLPDEHMPRPDPALAGFLGSLERPASIFTNARADYVRRGLLAMGIDEGVGVIHDIQSFDWRAKPEATLYPLLLEREDADPSDVAFVDDRLENLPPAAALGIATVLVDESDRHDWSERMDDGTSPYAFKIRHGRELSWLARPRLGLASPQAPGAWTRE